MEQILKELRKEKKMYKKLAMLCQEEIAFP